MEKPEIFEKKPYDDLYKLAESIFVKLIPASNAIEDRKRHALVASFLADVMADKGLVGFGFHHYTAGKQKEILSKYTDLSEIFENVPQEITDHYIEKVAE